MWKNDTNSCLFIFNFYTIRIFFIIFFALKFVRSCIHFYFQNFSSHEWIGIKHVFPKVWVVYIFVEKGTATFIHVLYEEKSPFKWKPFYSFITLLWLFHAFLHCYMWFFFSSTSSFSCFRDKRQHGNNTTVYTYNSFDKLKALFTIDIFVCQYVTLFHFSLRNAYTCHNSH